MKDRAELIELMARQGRTDAEWDNETVAHVKVQREIAEAMLEVLLAADRVLYADCLKDACG